MAGLLGGGGGGGKKGGLLGGYVVHLHILPLKFNLLLFQLASSLATYTNVSSHHSVLNTVGETTKGVPIVGGVTDPVLKTVGGVTEGLPIVRINTLPLVYLFLKLVADHGS
jgi:hypothetical protein